MTLIGITAILAEFALSTPRAVQRYGRCVIDARVIREVGAPSRCGVRHDLPALLAAHHAVTLAGRRRHD
jgi:hypothetical protein